MVQFRFLTEGFRKMAFLRADRTVEIHAQYGKHHTVRIPKVPPHPSPLHLTLAPALPSFPPLSPPFPSPSCRQFGRDLLYDPSSCDLYITASGPDVYRLNLEQGRFLSPFTSTSPLSPLHPGANCLAQSSAHPLLAVGREDGCVECWDPRDRSSAAVLNIPATAGPPHAHPHWADVEVTALAYSPDGLTLATGLSNGRVALYDLRAPRPTVVKDHRYGLPIVKVEWLDGGATARGLVVSTDAKSIRLWGRVDGAAYTAIESTAALNDSTVWPGSGLIMATGDQQRVQAWYIPQVGAAPGWCAFLDSLTEELEEKAETSVYEDYQFVTRDQLVDWGCDHLIGTNVLKAYMHGYFIHAKLYARLIAAHAEANPQTQGAVAAARPSNPTDRILQRRAGHVAVNARYASQLLEQAGVKRRLREEEKEEGKVEVMKNPLGDDRFAKMFKEEEFKIDEESEEYRRLHPSHPGQVKDRRREREEEEEDEVDERFERVEDDDDAAPPAYEDDDEEDDAEEDDESDEDDDVDSAPPSRKRKAQATELDRPGRAAPRAPQMFGLKRGVTLPSVLQTSDPQSSIPAAVQRQMTLEQRLLALQSAPPTSTPYSDRDVSDDGRSRRGRGGGWTRWGARVEAGLRG